MTMTKATGIYIHIPFCKAKCKYCDFLSFDMNTCTKANPENIERYFQGLFAEITETAKMKSSDNRRITSIFFGGGTPSMVASHYIVETLSSIYSVFDVDKNAEITIECNPGTLTANKLADYKKAGINRLSIGLQSANNSELAAIGRIHTFEHFLAAYKLAKDAGFENINIDIMSSLPYQTLNSYTDSLRKIVALKPAHISAYSLILEEGTPLFDAIKKDSSSLPSEDDEREMYYQTAAILKENGYSQYEISNYSKNGFHCKHNCLYWNRGEYFGFGLGASSFINDVRYKNVSDFDFYIENAAAPASLYTEITPITKEDAMSEFMYLGLRFTNGIRSNKFYKDFGVKLEEIYGTQINKLVDKKLLEPTDIGYKLTPYGVDVSNYVLAEFV